MKLQTIVAALALAATGAANASIDQINGGTTAFGDSSVLFVALDSTGTQTQSLTVDLGINYTQLFGTGTLTGAGQTVVWNFNANTITQNGNLVVGVTNDWAAQRDIFLANSDAGEAKWAIVAGSSKGTQAGGFIAGIAGTPTAAQFNSQNATATGNSTQVNQPLYNTLVTGNKGTILTADNGAYAAGATDSSYVGTAYGVTTTGGYRNNLKWNGWGVDGSTLSLYQLFPQGNEVLLPGEFTYNAVAGTLTYATAAAVPEPESYALALIGLVAVGAFARRRAAK